MDYQTWKGLLRRACDLCCEEYPTEAEAKAMFDAGLTYKQALDKMIDETAAYDNETLQ